MNNIDQNNSTDEQEFTYRTLFRNYMRYINNSNQILNNSIEVLTSQQNTYNNLINHYNNIINPHGSTYDYNINRSRFYPYRPSPLSRYTFPLPRRNVIVTNLPNSVQQSNSNDSRRQPSVSQVANSISYHIYENIDISTNCSCPITQRDFNSNDTVVMINTCKHIFEPLSLLQWFARCDSCPLCRSSIISPQDSQNISNYRYNILNNNSDILNQVNDEEQQQPETLDDNQDDNQDDTQDDNQDNNQDQDLNNNYIYNNSRYYRQFLNQTRSNLQSIRNSMRNTNVNNSNSRNFVNNLAEVINNEINRDLDFSGNILIELGITPR